MSFIMDEVQRVVDSYQLSMKVYPARVAAGEISEAWPLMDGYHCSAAIVGYIAVIIALSAWMQNRPEFKPIAFMRY